MQSALVSESGRPASQGDIVSRLSFCGDSIVPWKLVSVPTSEIDLQWFTEELNSKVCVVRKCDDDAFEVAVEPSYLPEFKDVHSQANVAYNPTQLLKAEKDVYGICEAKKKARKRWLRQVVEVIYSTHSPEVKQAYRDLTQSIHLQRELNREVLIRDISKSSASVQWKLAQNLVFLFLNLEANHTSRGAQTWLESDQDELLAALECGLQISDLSEGMKRDDSQITSLFRVLLELSGGKVDLLQHNFAENYTPNRNSDLYASVFGIKRTNDFGEFDAVEMCSTLSKSQVFSGMAISVQDLEGWTTKMKNFLHIGFRQGYLNFPSQLLSGLGVGQVNMFEAYLTHTYFQIPSIKRPENNVLLLLTWSTSFSPGSEEDYSCLFKAIKKWAQSNDGWNLYLRLTEEFQCHQTVEQLTLIMAALMNYRRLHPDFWDHSNHPITGSYIADLDALLQGCLLGNSGRVTERMVFALMRKLQLTWENYEDLIAFLETTLDRKYPPLHVLDGFSDKYICLRVDDRLLHGPAIMKLAEVRLPELRRKDDNTVDATQLEDSSIQKLDIQDTSEYDPSPSLSREDNINPPPTLHADCYTLIRVTNAQDDNVPELLDTKLGMHEAPSIEQLGDGSWEICVLKSSTLTVQSMLRKILPESDVDVFYNPFEPTDKDLTHWDFNTAKELRRIWFVERANRMAREGWPPAANHYAYRLKIMPGTDLPMAPTCRGYLESKKDASCLVGACLGGRLAHSPRGPRNREATVSGNIFVREQNSTGIDRWRDGMDLRLAKRKMALDS